MLLRSSFLIHFQSVQLITNYRCCALLMVSFTLLGRYKPLMPRGGWGSWVLVPIFLKKGSEHVNNCGGIILLSLRGTPGWRKGYSISLRLWNSESALYQQGYWTLIMGVCSSSLHMFCGLQEGLPCPLKYLVGGTAGVWSTSPYIAA